MEDSGPRGGAQRRAVTIADDFAGLVGWRQGRFRVIGKSCVLKLQGQQLSMVAIDDGLVFASPAGAVACGPMAGTVMSEGIFRLVVDGTAYDLFGMDLRSMRRAGTARKKIALGDRHHALDVPPEIPDLPESLREKLGSGINARIRAGWPAAWIAALWLRGARDLS